LKREHLSVFPQRVRNGQELARLFEAASMDYSSSSNVTLEGDAARDFAGMVDYLREYRDVARSMSETDKLEVFSDIQKYMDALAKAGFSLSCAQRSTKLVGENWKDKKPWPVSIAYVVVSLKGQEPKILLVPREVNLGW